MSNPGDCDAILGKGSGRHDAVPAALNRELYTKTLKLKAKFGMGAIRIARLLSVEYALNVSPRTVGHWLAGDRRPRIWNIFVEEPSPQLSYVIGAVRGDGSLVPKSYIVKLEVTDREFAERFNTALSGLFGRDSKNRIATRRFATSSRLPLYVVRYSSRQLLRLLQRPLKELGCFIRAYPREFLMGFFDAEGYPSVSAAGRFDVSVGAENTDLELLSTVRIILLENFGIRSSFSKRRPEGSKKVIRNQAFETRDCTYSLEICSRRDVIKFLTDIGFNIPRKMEKLRDAVRLLKELDPETAASSWALLYEKRANEWVRRSSLRA